MDAENPRPKDSSSSLKIPRGQASWSTKEIGCWLAVHAFKSTNLCEMTLQEKVVVAKCFRASEL